MTTEQKNFIEKIAAAVNKYKDGYNIKVASPIIAQAIIESGWGESQLAAKYNNYFGLKCGSAWTGKSVNMATSEEYTPGVHTNIRDNFRVFDSLEDGVKGYFEFINYSRYANLKGVTDPETYVKNIKADGYATSSTYVSTLINAIKSYNLTQYDNGGSGNATHSAVQAKVNQLVNGTPATPQKKSVEEVAREVIRGKWGNGADRKNRLTAAGYSYSAVQAKVNQLMK